MNLPPLAAIRCFEAAARHQSFTRAAGELGITQAAMSYQIKLLEERLGPLFLRRPRGVALTDTGRRLAPSVTAAFDGLRGAFEDLNQTAEGLLSITAVQTFATNWLVPRLGCFQAAHPNIAVRLDVGGRVIDFTREEFDVGFRHNGTNSWPGLVAHPLIALEFTPMLSPRLIEQVGPIKTPADLLKLPLIEPSDPWWPAWFALAGESPPDFAGRPDIRLGAQHLAGSAALAGQGVAMLTPAYFRDDLAEGRLVQPFDLIGRDKGHYCLVYPEARRRSPKIRAFRDWILATMAKEKEAAGGWRGTTLRYKCQVAWPSTGMTITRPMKNGIDPITRAPATIAPHAAIGPGFAITARTDVETAVTNPALRSSSSGNDTTLIASTSRAKRNPTPTPATISTRPASVVNTSRTNAARDRG